MDPNKFGKRGNINHKRPSYLRYDDVFMSKKKDQKHAHFNRKIPMERSNFDQDEKDYDDSFGQEYQDEVNFTDNHYEDEMYDRDERRFQKGDDINNILDERMVKYKKRQLPPLQRYGSNNPRDMYDDYHSASYWGDDGYDSARKLQRHRGDGVFFKSMWRKFLTTFGAILVLVFVSWIAYNFGSDSKSNRQSEDNTIIEPETSTFKVLPDNPGGVNVPHQDKMIYSRITRDSSELPEDNDNDILPPTEKPAVDESEISVDEYSIVDEKSYYIKIATNKNKDAIVNELSVIKNKYTDKIGDMSCVVKTVRDKFGERKYAVLIGPIESKTQAVKIAKTLNTDCSVISVKE